MKNAVRYTIVDTVLGLILIIGSDQGLRRISIHASRQRATEEQATTFREAIESPGSFGDLPQRLKRYARGERIAFNDKLDLNQSTAFQRAVWDATRAIPYGETRTYEWIAQRSGRPRAARPAGQALKHNPLPIVVPCHRVIGKDGGLTGFSAGVGLKKRLLDLEASPL
jgi:methylated-DNA-[protein]-cysteine S-methyltransferase